jgi:hypothetical protein
MRNDPEVDAQLAQEIAAAELERAARQFVAVAAQIQAGDATQELLRARRAALYTAAAAYCAAHRHAGAAC